MADKIYDAAFISDLHLSAKKSRIDDINSFFSDHKYKNLYIIGDIIDLWKLKISDAWPDNHTSVLMNMMKMHHEGVNVKYVVGNHDEWFEEFEGTYGKLLVTRKDILEINSKKFLIIHGDQYDISIKWFKAIGILGTGILDIFSKVSKKKPFSLSEYLEKKGDKLIIYDKALIKAVKKKGFDGVIFGHTHKPNLTIKDGLIYVNTGDFVKHSSFILKEDNKLHLMQYINGKAKLVKTLEI